MYFASEEDKRDKMWETHHEQLMKKITNLFEIIPSFIVIFILVFQFGLPMPNFNSILQTIGINKEDKNLRCDVDTKTRAIIEEQSKQRIAFAGQSEVNLNQWVPVTEKAIAKLFGS